MDSQTLVLFSIHINVIKFKPCLTDSLLGVNNSSFTCVLVADAIMLLKSHISCGRVQYPLPNVGQIKSIKSCKISPSSMFSANFYWCSMVTLIKYGLMGNPSFHHLEKILNVPSFKVFSGGFPSHV